MHPILAGAEFCRLLPGLPELGIYKRLLAECPASARPVVPRVVGRFVRAMQEGLSEDESLWGEWLAFRKSRGADDPGVRISLIVLILDRHEARHHLDFWSTPLGWRYPRFVEAQYLRASQLAGAAVGTEAFQRAWDGLRTAFQRDALLFGNVPRFDSNVWSGRPTFERDLPFGIVRVSPHARNNTLALSTIEAPGDKERAISLNAVLEMRAIIETTGHMSGRLRAAGASAAAVTDAVALLVDETVNTARDDYWTLLRTMLPARDLTEAADRLTGDGTARSRLMIGSWFALHMDLEANGAPAFFPALRLLLIRLFQQATTGSVRAWRARRFRRISASFNANSPPKRLVRTTWRRVAGRTVLRVPGAGMRAAIDWSSSGAGNVRRVGIRYR